MDVYIRRGTSAESYHRVLDDDLDAAIIVQPPFAIPKSCDWRILRTCIDGKSRSTRPFGERAIHGASA
jgi:hypothetical protein